jgi:hypothetical protein
MKDKTELIVSENVLHHFFDGLSLEFINDQRSRYPYG